MKKDPFDTLYGKLLRASRERRGDLWVRRTREYARRDTWTMHVRTSEIEFLALGTWWLLAIDPDEDWTTSFSFKARHKTRTLIYEDVAQLQPGWAKSTSIEEFLRSIWTPPPATTTPSGIPWEIATIQDSVALERAIDSYLSSHHGL